MEDESVKSGESADDQDSKVEGSELKDQNGQPDSEDEATKEYYSKMEIIEGDYEDLFNEIPKNVDDDDESRLNVPKSLEKKDLMLSFDIKERKY